MPEYPSLEIAAALETLGSRDRTAAAGSAAALAGALAAAVVGKAARASQRDAASAQAALLQSRLLRFAQTDALVLAEARHALAGGTPADAADDRRDFALGRALRNALTVPLRIAETCADIALLAAEERETVVPDHLPDLAAATAIAAGAAQGAAHLVAVNLAATPDDADVKLAKRFASGAADVVRLFAGP